MTDSSPSNGTVKPTVWVPLALPEDEARAVFNAVRVVFHEVTAIDAKCEAAGQLARAMVKIGEACDKAREEAA